MGNVEVSGMTPLLSFFHKRSRATSPTATWTKDGQCRGEPYHPPPSPTTESKLKINNSRFKLSPVNMMLLNNLRKGKEQLKKAVKASGSEKWLRTMHSLVFWPHSTFLSKLKHSGGQIPHSGQILALNKARYIVWTNFRNFDLG